MRQRVSAVVHTTFRSLAVRNFRLFFFGQLISQSGTWLTQVALTLLVLHVTKSGFALGLLVACQFGPMLLLGAYGGVVADRTDKRRLLLATQTLQMVQSFVLAALAFLREPQLLAFYVTAFAGQRGVCLDLHARRGLLAPRRAGAGQIRAGFHYVLGAELRLVPRSTRGRAPHVGRRPPRRLRSVRVRHRDVRLRG